LLFFFAVLLGAFSAYGYAGKLWVRYVGPVGDRGAPFVVVWPLFIRLASTLLVGAAGFALAGVTALLV
jgi:hypothetical protein